MSSEGTSTGISYGLGSSCSRAYHLFDDMVDAHCVLDEGGFTVHWLLRFIGLGVGYIYSSKSVPTMYVVEKAVRRPRVRVSLLG